MLLLPKVLALVVALLAPTAGNGDLEPTTGWLCRAGTDGLAFRTASAAFWLQEGESLHPLARPTDALTFETLVDIDADGTYRFGVSAANGDVRLEVRDLDGRVLGSMGGPDRQGDSMTEPVELEIGEVRLIVRFQLLTTPASGGGLEPISGMAALQVLWERLTSSTGGFPLEPLPSSFTIFPEDGLAAARRGALGFRGRVLLEELGCTNCHAAGPGADRAVGRRRGPDLASVGERADLEWLTSWIRDPRAHGARGMPALLESADGMDEARALAHFLANRSRGDQWQEGWSGATEPEVLARGRELYHRVGCVACHGALESAAAVYSDDYLSAERPSSGEFPLDGRANKWNASALSAFLLDPTTVRPGGRMPSLGLTEAEADYIANYLIARLGGGEPRAVDSELALVGREQFEARGCAACHALGEGPLEPLAGAPSLMDLDPGRGCLATDGKGPRYALEEDERAALVAALAELGSENFTPAPLDEAARRMAALRCTACHEQDGAGGLPEDLDVFFRSTDERTDLGDEGRLPPDLTGVGSKLQPQWMASVLADGARARPYLGVRMPHFGEAAEGLAVALAHAEGTSGLGPPGTDAPIRVTDELIRIGRELVGPEDFNCMTCHVFGDYPATGSPGPAITQFAERLTYGWFRRYMQNPQRYKPGSRMPDFGVGGRSNLVGVYDGDMARQVDALWAYFQLGEFMPAPDGVESGSRFALAVGDRPIVHRGFLLDVGSRGIAVGLPVGVHFAFDAATCRLVHAWKGPFIDAAGSWAGRGGTELGGQGPVVWTAAEGPTFRLAGEPELAPRFHGYRLDADGWPTFLWSLGPVSIAERFDAELAPRLEIRRHFEFAGLAGHELLVARDAAQSVPQADGGARLGEADGGWVLSAAPPDGQCPTLDVEVHP